MSKTQNDELQDLLHDPNVGIDVVDRKANLAKAKRATRLVTIAAIIVSVWLWVPIPYDVALFVGILFPVIPILVWSKYKYVVTLLNYTKQNVRPNISTALTFPPLFLCLKSLVSYDLLNYWSCIVPVLIVLSIIVSVLYFLLPKTGKGVGKYDYLILALGGLPYCYGSVVMTNCHYDNSKPLHYETTVLSKFESGSRSTSYNLHLKKWGSTLKETDVRITHDEYDKIKPGQTVTISLKAGLLNIPWYYLTD